MTLHHTHAWVPVEQIPGHLGESTDYHTVYRCSICGQYGYREWPRVGYFKERPRDESHAGKFVLFRSVEPTATPSVPPIQAYATGARTARQRQARRNRDRKRGAFVNLPEASRSARNVFVEYVDDPATLDAEDVGLQKVGTPAA